MNGYKYLKGVHMEFAILLVLILFSFYLASKLFKPGKPDPFRNYDND
ncbi:hypothetical protein [Ignavibacterium sp.]